MADAKTLWDNGGMHPQASKGPNPWLSPILTVIAILVAIVWAYLQMRHWKEPEADYVAIAFNIAVTFVLWILLVVLIARNLWRRTASGSQGWAEQQVIELTAQLVEKSAAASARDEIIEARNQTIRLLEKENLRLHAVPLLRSWEIKSGMPSGPIPVPTVIEGGKPNNGWRFDGSGFTGSAVISHLNRPERSVWIKSGMSALIRDVEPALGQYNVLAFAAKLPTREDKFYFRIALKDAKQKPLPKPVWFHCVHGDSDTKGRAELLPDPEYDIDINGNDLGDGWFEYKLIIPREIERVEELAGCSFSKLVAIQVRGSVGIGPIRLFSAMQQSGSVAQ